jgi:hypothetical protein
MAPENHKLTHCPNCNQPLAAKDRFCRNCGQSTRDLKVPFKHLVLEALEGVFHIDNNIFRTIGALLFKPGLLTAEFIAGRRKRYVPPVRLYIFISFIFFLIIAVNPAHFRHSDSHGATGETQKDFFDSEAYNKSIISFNDMKTNDLKGMSDTQIDSILAAREIAPTWINRHMARRLARIGDAGRAEFRHQTHKGISYMMFFLMPVFGWIVYLFNRKRAKYYLDCLIFSVHFHCFVFILLAGYKIFEWFGQSSIVSLAVLLIMIIYLLLASIKAFGQSWLMDITKTLAISIIYALLTATCMIIMLFLSVATF